MNAATKAKIQASRQSRAAEFAAQIIKVDENWIVQRADEFNLEIVHRRSGRWQFYGYFGTLISAFNALPAKMLGEEAKISLNQVIESQKAINERIAMALWDAKKFVAP